MKAEKVLKIFAEAVEKKEYRFITENVIEKDGYFFTSYNCYSDGTCFVGEEKKSDCAFTKLIDLGSITTLKELKMRLGL